MKRDWDIIREILLKIEQLAPNALLTLDSFAADKQSEISCHLEILQEAGLLQGKIHKTPGGSPHGFHLLRLTWSGYDLLEYIRSDIVWEEIKQQLSTKQIAMQLENIMAIAQAINRK
ncbi:hypothetical protein Lqui_0870 [Legionella quinlivanii]|uniref:DUF2513 domain-containing protein n=1 Tax=Legionella quinlivanii TaxID=45073 RepID=A0A0W0Y5E6_9GAMM|nr:DUF2513 domain-containing protein [Legionella quinlivanii]KTD52026.1 hypothetical protein Lqui_0870 [Legionella quinlivanii]MCW8452290.1 DUF2513 domain-containing protein [Legionella quinlivanii]SEF87984.1 Hypothetical protein SAMN02746093_01333 [Legionella quinlivanii DSM 21216]STY12478.1 Uncharacterised protein [Legionella quinlivanii]